MTKTPIQEITITEARWKLSDLITDADARRRGAVITRNGKRRAVIIGYCEYLEMADAAQRNEEQRE